MESKNAYVRDNWGRKTFDFSWTDPVLVQNRNPCPGISCKCLKKGNFYEWSFTRDTIKSPQSINELTTVKIFFFFLISAVRFGRVPKREKARILAAMQQSTQNRGQQRVLASELDDEPRLLAAILRAHTDTCEFTRDKVNCMRQRARECPNYSKPTLVSIFL